MEIRNIKHKGLKAFIERGQEKGLPSQYIGKVRDIIGFLLEIDNIDEVFALKKYKPHRNTGDRAGQFSLPVTPNWRITFSFDAAANEIFDLNFEDYH